MANEKISYEDAFGATDPSEAPLDNKPKGVSYEDAFGLPPSSPGILRKAGDLGLSVAKGVIGVPEAAVGLLDIPTGGAVGKFLENEGGTFGFRPKQAKDYLSSFQSDDLQAKQKQFQDADGVLDKAGVALSNPSLLANAVAESVPSIGAGGVAARGLLAAAPRIGAVAAGALGEGAVSAGSAASNVRQETEDGLLTAKQSGLAAATGAATALFGFAGGKIAQRLGIGDVDTMLTQGAIKTAGAPSAKSIPRQVVEGAIAEGWLEELPQSVSEQVLQNLALNKPWHEGVSDAAVMGTLAGMAMGGGAAGVSGFAQDATTQNIAAASDGLGALGPAFTTTPGAVDPNAAQAPVAQAPEAPDLSTTLGAGVPRDGVPFTRDIDTSGLAIEDRGAMERARAAMVDYQPGDTTPQWETSMGAAAARQGLDMPAPEFDTGTLGLESQGRALTPSERMGINPAAGALSRAAAVAVDSGATPVQFLGATGRDLQARATGPGVTNESNVIDVQGRLVEDRAISTPRRLTDQQDGMAARAQGDRLAFQPPAAPSAVPALGGPVGTDAARGGTTAVPDGVADGRPGGGSAAGNGTGAAEAGAARAGGRGNSNPALSAPTNLREGLARMRARRQEAADAQTAAQSAPTSAPAVSAARPGAVEAAGAAPFPATTGVNREPSPTQAIQASAQPAQTGPAPAASDAGPGAQGGAAAPAPVGSGEPAAGLTDAATPQNNGAQAAPATGPQGAAQAAQAGVAPRPKNWRTSMLGATPVAKAMGIDTKGKRLAQVVAEIDARDTQAPATPAPAPAPGPTRLGRDNTPLSEGGKPFKTRKAAGDAKKLQPMMRVVTVPGGYALAEKTPTQLAAEERAAKRLRTPRTSPAGEPVPAHAFIAASGGLHMRHRNDLGVDGNPRIGNRRLFGGLNRGLSIEQATEMLVADGYLSEGASHNDAYALIKKSLSQPQYNADGIERIAQAESDAQFEDYMAAQEEAAADGDTDPFGMADEFTAEELDEVGYTAADPALQAEVSALIAQAEAMDIDTFAILEDIARTYANATQDQYNAAARDALAAAIARSNQDGGSVAAQAAPAAEPAAEQGLNRPSALTSKAQAATENVAPEALELAALSPAQAAAQQDAQEQAAKAEAAAKRAEDAAAKAEEERKRIAQASVRAADRFELGQDPMDSLTGQGSIFDAPELPSAPDTPAQPIQDAGQKIGGARKDRWKERGLNLDDLDSMTESEGAELATKANVWKPDYEAMSEASEPVTAAMVKTIYDQLAAKPKKNTPEGRRQYVQMMRIVRDVLTEADGPEAVKNAYQEIRKRAGLNTLDPKVKADGRELLFSVYKGRSDPFVFGFNELQRAKKLVEDGFPAKAAPWKSRLSVGRREGGNGTTERGIEIYMERSAEVGTPLTREQILGGFYRVSTKDNKAVAFAASKADAEAAAATVYERDMKGKKDGKPEPVRPNLDELKRENLPKRIERDVKADDFVNDLGFRGIEFGNWSAQDERQRILNMAYDGLMDLAEIMGVPPKAMSLNGTLGMAFGARGGGRFAAHYEPGKLVINMTKIRGGGSMAHEWAHAMDHYFGELDKPDAYTTQARGASGWYSEDQYLGVPRKRMERVGNEWKNVEKMRLDNLRPEMAAAFDEVMRALFQKQVTKAEMVRSQELDLERTESLVQQEQDAEMKAMYQRMATNKQQALNELRGDPDGTMYAGRGRSDYASQAQALSGKSVDGYWVRPTEMFARAFESWVFDRVTAMGAKSDYLVHGVEEDRFAGGNYKGNPYPSGEERARINAAFDKLASTIKTKETDKGVAMFSRAPSAAPTADSNARNVATQLLVDGLKAKWTRSPEIIVARNMQDRHVPQAVRDYDAELKSQGSDGEARGFIYKGKVYLLSDQLKGPEQIAEVLFHEVLGHYGLRGAFGESLTPILQQIGTMRRRDVVAKAREYGLFDKDALGGMDKKTASVAQIWAAMSAKDRLSAAEEVLAEMAQTQPNIGFVQRTIAAIRNWLRTNVPGFERLRLTDADIVQAYIIPARGYVTRSKETGAQSLKRAMLAFSRGGADAEAALRELAADAQAPGNANKTVVLGPVSSRQLELLQREGVPVDSGFTHAADMFAVRHALNRHGDAAVEAKQGQLPLGEVDIAAVPKIIASADALILGAKTPRGQDIVGSLKRMPDGTVLYLEEVRSGRKTLAMTSMRKYPGTTDFETIKDRIVPSYARSDTGDVRIVYPEAATGQAPGTASDQINFSRAPVAQAPAAAATSGWDAPVQTGFDDVIYKLQDKNIDLKRVVEAITKSAGQVADSVNAYLKEELFHKRAAKRVEDFGARELKPLMNQMRLMGLGMEDVEEYLHARHAKEANAVIAQRNPGEPGLQDGGSGMTNQAADNYFAKLDPAQRRKLEAVAKNVDAIIDKTRKLYVSYGLENQDVVDGWASMYQHYIPLMREDKEGGMGIGQGFSVKGKETKGRTGSTRKVVDILANIASQREKLIVRGEKNQVTQALIGLARANPNSDFWEVRSQAPTERVFDPKKGIVVDRPDPLFKSRDNVVVAKVQDSKGNVTEQMVVFNEDNPRAVRMAASMKNLDAGNLEGLLGMSAKVTRYFSAINTQYNPVFGVVNLVRDVQGAMVNLAATPLAGQQGKIARDTVSALAGIYSDIRKTRKGGQASSKWAQLWEQMQDDGGTTGYRELFTTSADRANNLKSILNPQGWMDSKWGKVFTADGKLRVPMSMAQKGASEIFGWLSDYNEAMENGVRLAAYKAALDMGMSREQAASLAKNLTVNFNRKGQVGMQAGAVYAFFNAAMQGTARIGQTLFDMDGGDISTLRLSKTGKAVVYGGVTLGVMQALALAGAGFGEEDPPEFVRERSLIIPTGGKTYVSIPMPLGLHVIPGIGRHATEFALSGFDKPAKRALSVIGMFADAFNPIGNAGLSMQTLAPTALDPLVALTENKDWTGKPIARVSFNKALPGHTQWKDTATWYSKMAAEAINWVSGGNEYVAGALSPTPDQIDYLVAQVGGGVAREASKVFQAASTTVNGEELPTYKIPLLGRFAGNAASQASQGTAFYANLDKLNALETEIKGLRKDGRFGEAAQLARENPQAAMIPMANRAERDVQKLRRDKRELIATGATREEVRAKEAQITAVMARLNEAAARRKATSPE